MIRERVRESRPIAAAGADWVSGSTRMNLQTRQVPEGEYMWWAETDGEEFRVPVWADMRS